MRTSRFAVLGASVLLLASAANAGDAGVEGAIIGFETAFNKGDVPAAKDPSGWKIAAWTWTEPEAAPRPSI